MFGRKMRRGWGFLAAVLVLVSAQMREVNGVSACKEGGKDSINIMNGLPRRNFGFSKVSNNLGAYDSPVEICPLDQNSICEASWLEEYTTAGIEAILDTDAGSDAGSWINYFQSVLMYSFIAIAFAIITIIAGVFACCCRLCCCRGVGVAESSDPEKGVEYPMWQTVATYFCLAFFILIVFTFTLLAHVRGNKAFTEAQIALVDSPDNLVEFAAGISEPAVNLLTNVVGTTGVDLIINVNQTVVEGANLTVVHEAVQCAKVVYEELTNSSLIDPFIVILDGVNISLSAAPSVSNVSSILATVTGNVSAIETELASLTSNLTDVQTSLDTIDLGSIEGSVSAVESQVSAVNGSLNSLETFVDGYLDASTSAGALDTAITNALDATPSATELSELSAAYSTFLDDFTALSPADDLGSLVIALNDTIQTLDGILGTLESDLQDANTALSSAPSATDLSASLATIAALLDSFDLGEIESQLGFVFDFIFQLPSTKPILDKIQEILDLQLQIPCVFQIVGIPENVDANLVELPSEFLNFTNELFSINDTLTEAVVELDTVLGNITDIAGDFNGTLQQLTLDYEADLSAANATLQSAKQTIMDLQTEITNLGTEFLNLTGPLLQIQNARADLTSSTLLSDPGSADDDAEVARSGLQTLVTVGMNSTLAALAAAAPPSLGNQNCLSAPFNQCYNSGTNDIPVPPPPYCGPDFSNPDCPYPIVELQILQVALSNFVNNVTNLTPDLATIKTSIGDAKGTLDSVDLSCCTDLSDLSQLKSDIPSYLTAVSDAQSDLSTLNSQLAAVETEYTNAFSNTGTFSAELDSIRAELIAFNDTTILEGFEEIEFVFEKEEQIFNLVFNDLAPILDELRTARLNDIASSPTGLQDLIRHAAAQLDSAIGAVEPNSATLSQEVDSFLQYLEIVDAVRDNGRTQRDQGSFYYLEGLFSTVNNSTLLKTDEASFFESFSKPTVEGAIVNGKIEPYPDDILCITDDCIKRSIRYYNEEGVKNFAPAEFNDVAAIPLSRTQITALPFIIPSIMLIIAIMVFFVPQCGYCLACCSVCVAPWLFVLIGGLSFPLIMLTADVCGGVESVGVTVATELAPYLCSQINGTLNTANNICEIEVNVPPLVKTIQLDPPELLESILNDCEGSSSANLASGTGEPLESLILSFGNDASQIVSDQLDDLLDDVLPGLGLVFRPLLRNVVLSSGSSLEGDITTFANDLNAAIGCEQINDVYLGVKDTFCCDFASAFYWSFAGWYLIAFSMLFCGLPVGCFAATRLRNIKRSRAQMREFYARMGETRVGQQFARAGSFIGDSRLGQGVARATAVVTARFAGSQVEGESAAVAVPVDEFDDDDGARGGGRLAAVGSSLRSLGSSFRSRFAKNKTPVAKPAEDIEDDAPNYASSSVAPAQPNDDLPSPNAGVGKTDYADDL